MNSNTYYIEDNFRDVIWNTKVPVKIDMALEDINDVEKPPSLYVIKMLNIKYCI
jgi:hypothetical protein